MSVKKFVDIGLLACAMMIVTGCSERKPILIRFDDVGLLSIDDPVKYRGVKVGKITSIQSYGKSVLVNIEVDVAAQISTCDTGIIDHIGMMGERQIRILPCNSNSLASKGDTLVGLYPKIFPSSIQSFGEILDTIQSIREKALVKRLLDSINVLNLRIKALVSQSSNKKNNK